MPRFATILEQYVTTEDIKTVVTLVTTVTVVTVVTERTEDRNKHVCTTLKKFLISNRHYLGLVGGFQV